MIMNNRLDELISKGVMYRFDGLKDPVANGAQFYFVVKASPNKNVIVEKYEVESTEGEFSIGVYMDEPYTGGTEIPVTENMDPTYNSQLQAVVVATPTVTAAPLALVDADFASFVTNGEKQSSHILTVPAGHHAVVMVDNDNKASVSAKMIIRIYMREEGRQ